ncbi:MAG: response regulator [Clostridiales bacterium]|nr:response regulator [Clostridiales bacterium]
MHFQTSSYENVFVKLNYQNGQLKNRTSVISSLGSIYEKRFSIDLVNNNFSEITQSGRIISNGNYYSIYKKLENISEEYNAKFLEFLDIETIPERLENNEMITFDYVGKDDKWHRAALIANNYKEGEEITSALLVIQNIDNEKRKEIAYNEELKEKAEEAIRASLAKSEFLSRMSHDIRTPINGIRGMLEIIRKNNDDIERRNECINKIDMASNYLLSLINDVLDMSKLESGKMQFYHEIFDLQEVLESVPVLLTPQAHAYGIKVNPPVVKNKIAKYLIGSPLHLKQVITNIGSNAIKYNRPNGQISITIDQERIDEDHVLLIYTTSDTGIGMSPEFQAKIFEPFTQENSGARTEFKGTGLGLAIVKKMVDGMGGTITFSSEVGVGSTFVIKIPFEIDKTNGASLQKKESVVSRLDDVNILIAEDNELNMEIAVFMLKDAGANVTCVKNGQEGIDEFLNNPPGTFDIILTDVMMPFVDGFELTKAIRENERPDAKEIPIIAMSANVFLEDVKKCKDAGMNDHIAKPLDMTKAVNTIAKYVSK